MKKIYTLFAVAIVALMASVNANAQGGFRWGLMGGANFSKFSTNAKELKSNLLTSFHIGPMVEFELPIFPVAFEAGVLYTQKGTELSWEGIQESFQLKSNMIEVPVNVKGYVFSIPAARFFVVAGPSFSYALSSNVQDIKFNELKDLKAKKFGVNLNAGIGVEVLKYLQLSAMYNAAMTNGYELSGKSVNDFLNTKEKGFSVTARLLF